MKRFLIGLGLGAPVGVALALLFIKGTRMPYYMIAESVTLSTGQREWRFTSQLYTSEHNVKYSLDYKAKIGIDLSKILVFGASTPQRLGKELDAYNRGRDAVVVYAINLLRGVVPFGSKEIEYREQWVDQQGVKGEAQQRKTLEDLRRLEFYRWLVQTGRLNENG